MTKSRRKPHATPNARELRLDLALAERWVKTSAANAKVARTEAKRSRKAHRQAKRVAKEARKELKALKKKLKAALAASAGKSDQSGKARPSKKETRAAKKPATRNSSRPLPRTSRSVRPAVEATALADAAAAQAAPSSITAGNVAVGTPPEIPSGPSTDGAPV
jgi:hypothetical protein